MNTNSSKKVLNTKKSNKDSFCIYPFKSINVMPAGNVKPCCAFSRPIEKDNLDMSIYEYPLKDIWDSDVMRAIRQDMIKGKSVMGCEYCYKQEQQRLTSMREEVNMLWEKGFLNEEGDTIIKLKTRMKKQGFRIKEGPEYLDLDVGNLCNLKCRMCNATYSSGIAADPIHSRWEPTTSLARWQGSSSIVAPRRIIGVAYEGLGHPDQGTMARTAWTNGNAAIRLSLPTVDLVGFSVKFSAEKPDNHPIVITANDKVLFDDKLPAGGWEQSFDWPLPASSSELELRFNSPVFKRLSNNDTVGIGIDEVKLLRSEVGKSTVTFSRFSSGKQWFQDQDFLIKELLANPESIKKLNVIGGEPLLIKEVRQLMHHLIEVGVAKQITLVLTTNGMYADDEWFELAANFRHVIVAVSIDGFGTVNEYIRYPSKWEIIAANLRRFREQANTNVFVNDTVQVYNVLNITELVDFCDELDIPFRFHLLSHPAHLSVQILPINIRQEAANRLRSYLKLHFLQTDSSAKTLGGAKIEIGKNIQQLISALEGGLVTADSISVKDFMMFTNDLDQSREQNIKDTFPNLVQGLAEAGFPWIFETKFSKQNLFVTKDTVNVNVRQHQTWKKRIGMLLSQGQKDFIRKKLYSLNIKI